MWGTCPQYCPIDNTIVKSSAIRPEPPTSDKSELILAAYCSAFSCNVRLISFMRK